MIIKSLDIDEILQQIVAYGKTTLGQEIIANANFIQSQLVLKRELTRQREALEATVKQGRPSFFGIVDVFQQLTVAAKGGTLDVLELMSVGNVCKGINGLRRYDQNRLVQFNQLDDLFESLVDLSQLSNRIDHCFSNDGEVYDQASEALFSIRKRLAKMDVRINQEVNRFLEKHRDILADSYSTIKKNRIVIPVQSSYKNSINGIVHDQSASGQTTFLEPQFLIDLNNEKQNLIYEEHQEIVRICQEISAMVGEKSEIIAHNLQCAGQLDAYFAKAQWAHDREGCVAQLSDGSLILKNARHPLIDPKVVVGNTYEIIGPMRMVLITGPNTGGKTVGLKTIGSCVYLTHCGFPIICDEAQVPMVDGVFADIGDQQSIVQSLSTFSGHLSNLKVIIDEATDHSLVLLDELGSGTDPIEGESLAIAVLEHLHQLACYAVVTTHFNRLKEFASNRENVLSSSVQFDLDRLVPTYRYKQGLAGQSYALDIASKLKLNSAIISRAKTIKQESTSLQQQLIEKLNQQLELQQVLNDQLKQQQLELQQQQSQLALEQKRLEQDKQSILKTFEMKQQQQLDKVLKKAKDLLASIRIAEKQHEVIASVNELEQLLPSGANLRQEIENQRDLVVGDFVSVIGSNQIGQIKQIQKREATIEVNGIKMRVPLKQLLLSKKVTPKSKKTKATSHVVSAKPLQSYELNIIGLRFEEAMIEVENFLDQCVLSKLKMARIVHGHGTGALRNGVQNILKKHKQVANFRYGGENEGGVGATVVEFK